MKKISLFLSLLLAFAGATKAQVLVEDAAEELTDGTAIALQCRDYSAGAGYYFAGANQNKSATFSANNNMFVVEGNAADGMKLRRFNGNKYIGKSGDAVTEVESAAEAITFTAKSYKKGNFILDNPGAEMDGTEESRARYVRFFVKDQSTFLNTRGLTENPQYASGKGGYSVWYVYKFPEYTLNLQQVSQTSLSFERTGTGETTTADKVHVTVSISDGGEDENSTTTADFDLTISNTDSPTLSNTEKFPTTLLCPYVNIGNGTNADETQVSAQLKFTLTNLPLDFSFSRALLDIHALDAGGNYHSNARYCDITLSCGEGENKVEWPTLGNKYITQKNGISLTLTGESIKAKEDGTLVLTLNITKGRSNSTQGLFVGLSGITLIDEERESKEVYEETITEMKIVDVQDLLKVIEDGYEKLNGDIESDNEDLKYKFPVQADGVTNVVWPQALNDVFTGLDDNNFELLTHAQKAIKGAKNENTDNIDNLDAAKQNLADFIRICKLDNNNYPVSVVYTAAADYGTLYTPFAVTLPDGLTLQKCTGCADNVLILSEEENNSSAAVANTAYIVKANDESAVGTTVQLIGFYSQSNTQANSSSPLKGTHTGTTLTAGGENNYYVLQNLDVLGFYEVGEKDPITVPAHKCYLQLPAGLGVKCLLFPDGTLTAIDGVDAAKPADAATYDLSGRRVSTTTKGLYIVGGKKVIVK